MKPYGDDEDDGSSNGPDRAGGFVPDFVRRMAIAGLGAVFMTEEGLRSLAGQLKLPKELLGYIVQQADKTKGEVGRVLSEEIRRFLQSETLRNEFVKLLAGTTIELKAEIRLVPAKKAGEELAPEPAVITRFEPRAHTAAPVAAPQAAAAEPTPATPPNVSPSVAEDEVVTPKVTVTHVGTRRTKKTPKRE